MNVAQEAKQDAIKALMITLGHGDVFPRVIAEIQRVNKAMPGAEGEDKKKRVIADAKIIFDDLVVPVVGQTLNFLIEAALVYLSTQNPVAGAVASAVVPGIEAAVKEQVNSQIEANR